MKLARCPANQKKGHQLPQSIHKWSRWLLQNHPPHAGQCHSCLIEQFETSQSMLTLNPLIQLSPPLGFQCLQGSQPACLPAPILPRNAPGLRWIYWIKAQECFIQYLGECVIHFDTFPYPLKSLLPQFQQGHSSVFHPHLGQIIPVLFMVSPP